jgi:hypothetical protein
VNAARLACTYNVSAKPAMTAVRTTAYQVTSRQRIDLTIDHVPQSATGLNEILAELAADIRHVHLDQI